MWRTIFWAIALFGGLGAAAQNDTLIVGADRDYPPFSFVDMHGQPAGYDIEVMRQIAKITGLKVKFELDDWDTILTRLKDGQIDVVAGIVYSSNRLKDFAFSFPLHTEYYAIFAKKDVPIADVHDLEGKPHAVLAGDISNDIFYAPLGMQQNQHVALTLTDAFADVAHGSSDYLVAPYSIGMEIVQRNELGNVVVKGDPIAPSVFCYAVSRKHYELVAWINQGIEIMNRDGDLQRIYDNWVKYKRKESKYEQFFYFSLIALLTVVGISIILFLFWYSLRKQVKKKTSEIKKNELIYKNVFNSVDEGLIILDNSRKIISINQMAYHILGLPQLPIRDTAFLGTANLRLILDFAAQISTTQHVAEHSLPAASGVPAKYVQLTGIAIRAEQMRYLVVIRDITSEREHYRRLQEAKHEAETANLAKSTFLSTISHEIRTPLFAILGFAELMGNTALSEKQKDCTKKIDISGRILLNLVNNILDLTKLEAEKFILVPEVFHLGDLIDDLCEIESIKALQKNILIQKKINPHLPSYFEGDKVQILRVLLNILNNAIKFSENNPVKISVTSGVDFMPPGSVFPIEFAIRDYGIGILPEEQSRLFRPFEQVRTEQQRKLEGTGLGLAISQQLAVLMGGTIALESQWAQGSIFRVTLPLKVAQVLPTLSRSEDVMQVNGQAVHVLLVEDNEFNAQIIIDMLSDSAFAVAHAANGQEALAMLAGQAYDVVLMDIEMPVLGGFETTQRIREMGFGAVPIVALSAHNLASEKDKALMVGMQDYLHKPISARELQRVIRKYTSDVNRV